MLELDDAYQNDMKEENAVPLCTDGHSVELSFKSFEVKTLRLKIIK